MGNIVNRVTYLNSAYQRSVPRWIRTTDLQLRRLLLYPAELSGLTQVIAYLIVIVGTEIAL